jgi:hypothetical protein
MESDYKLRFENVFYSVIAKVVKPVILVSHPRVSFVFSGLHVSH